MKTKTRFIIKLNNLLIQLENPNCKLHWKFGTSQTGVHMREATTCM